MKKTKNSGELQSRREFFKKAAKGALPILGAIILAGTPSILNASESAPMGCNNSCYNTCTGCRGTCVTNCAVHCSGCGTSCFKGCAAGCRWGSGR